MHDLTQGSVSKHLLRMAAVIATGMLIQTLYFLIDLYFVSRLGKAAIAGVGSAGNVAFLVLAFTQILNAGTVSLIAQAVGRRDRIEANLVFNQAILIAGLLAGLTLMLGYTLTERYMATMSADAETAAAGRAYLRWYLPGLALQFVTVGLGAALSGTGIVKPTMIVQSITVLINAVLAPVLIVGWGTGRPMGAAGAGLASTLAIAIGVVLLLFYFVRLEHFVGFARGQQRPQFPVWARLFNIGLPVGGEFLLMFILMGLMYWAIRDFGSAVQAGYGIGARVMQAVFLPAMAIAFAAAPVAGQNYGAQNAARVRETFRLAATYSVIPMTLLTLLCWWRPHWLVQGFSSDAAVLEVAAKYLQIMSWNFVAVGLVFTCSSLFQAFGNTWPSLMSSAARLIVGAVPLVWLVHTPGSTLAQFWYVSVASMVVQAAVSWSLLRREMRLRLTNLVPLGLPQPSGIQAAGVASG